MKPLISIIVLYNSIIIANAQGAWDMEYFSIDSINNKWIGKEVRLDFKTFKYEPKYDSINTDFDIRRSFYNRDTVFLEIDGEIIEYLEDWKYYVDHGVLSEQTLRNKIKSKEIIKEQFIKSITDTTVIIEMCFYKTEECKSKKMIFLGSSLVAVDKQCIKGVVARIY